jgi:ABC-type lipopolysaccharide export system ATPase subunit
VSYQVAIMYVVAALFALIGAGLLLALLRPSGAGKVYAFRMVGIMALALGAVLAASATAMWRWSLES